MPDYSGPFDRVFNEREVIYTWDEYVRLFDGVDGEKIIGECSNSYFFFPAALRRIREWLGDMKIVVMLRNPIERAYSHYREMYSRGHERLAFRAALDAEDQREKQGWRFHYQYRKQSLYARRLSLCYELFGSERVSVQLFEDLEKDPLGLFRNLCLFLGADPGFDGFEPCRENVTLSARSRSLQAALTGSRRFSKLAHMMLPESLRRRLYQGVLRLNSRENPYNPPLEEETAGELCRYFAEDIKEVEQMLDRDLSEWK
jgi:hypothetical protein